MKRFFALLGAIALLLSGCGKTLQPAETNPTTDPTISTAPPAEATFSKTDKDMFTERDGRVDYDPNKCVTIRLDGNTASASSNSVNINGSTVTITEEATYLIQGKLDNGMLVINAPDSAKLQLIFDGVHIANQTSAALYIPEADKVFITLAEGSQNSLQCGESFVSIDDSNIDGAIFSREDLTFNGSGTLTVTAPGGHGIVCKDDLVLAGGNYVINSASHGLDVNDSVRIQNAALTIQAGKDGIHAENSDDTTLGFCYISGGTITVDSQGDGISAGSYIQVNDGLFNLIAGGGYENGSSKNSGNYGGFMGGFMGGGFGGGRPGGSRPEYPNGNPSQSSTQEDTADDTSMKGFKSGAGILLSDGVYNLDTADDAIHSNGELIVNGGVYNIASGDDALHGETTLTVTSCTMEVRECYEGLEAEKIYVSGGEMTLTCSDDGLNAAGGTDSSGTTGGRDGMFGGGRPGGFGGGFMGGSNENALIQVSGGKLTIYAGGDGLDSNGNLTISGGYTIVYNPRSGDTSVLDSDRKPAITGGTYIGLGITTAMAEIFSKDTSTQGFLAGSVGALPPDTEITVTDNHGNVILSCSTKYSTALVILSCPEIAKGESYTLTVGEQTQTVTAS